MNLHCHTYTVEPSLFVISTPTQEWGAYLEVARQLIIIVKCLALLRSSPTSLLASEVVGMTIWGGCTTYDGCYSTRVAWNKKRSRFDDRERNIVELEGRTAWNAVIKKRSRFDDRERNVVELEGRTAWNAVIKKRPGFDDRERNIVELEGIEPSSKQGDHKLSTCLVQFWFSCHGLTWTTEPWPYPLRLHRSAEARADYSRICCTAYPAASGRGLQARCLVPMSNKGMKPIYCTSIMLREHKSCCQINFCKDEF